MDKFAVYKFPLGFLEIGYAGEKVFSLKKTECFSGEGEKNSFTDAVFREISEYFQGVRRKFTFPCELRGTEFQKKVWCELAKIPYGEIRTYKDVAIASGNPRAVRAVGHANNKNPLCIVIPCHRVIGSNGKLVGYAGGLWMKEFLLKLESENKSSEE